MAAVKAARARLPIDPIDRRRRVYFYGALGCVARGIPRVEIREDHHLFGRYLVEQFGRDPVALAREGFQFVRFNTRTMPR